MIIHSIRLKNIKSYGEGPDGNGITVSFQPGINRIAGRNGHGKSTLIESLGYALFLTDPLSEERFDLGTYFVRTGKKAGEIDVVFEFNGETHRVERGLGSQSKRRAKVILTSDGSTEAEGDEAVSLFLCSLFGFSDPSRIAELFSKLLGIKQGRLTWPFDSKPVAARAHFDPLLDVEVFRQCYEQLRPVVKSFTDQVAECGNELAGVEERIQGRVDSPGKVGTLRVELKQATDVADVAAKEKEAAGQALSGQELKEKEFLKARDDHAQADNRLRLIAQRRNGLDAQVKESKAACEIIASNQPSHTAWIAAEEALRGLQKRQVEKAGLLKQRGESTQSRTASEGKAAQARTRAKDAGAERQTRMDEGAELKQAIESGQEKLDESKPAFDLAAGLADRARRSQGALEDWGSDLESGVQDNADRAESILRDAAKLAAWDPQALVQADSAEREADKKLKALATELASVVKLEETLTGQLRKLEGGICPFLKDPCKQFDPSRVRAEMGVQTMEIGRLERAHTVAVQAHQAARKLAERLGQEKAALAESRKSVAGRVSEFMDAHNGMFPVALQNHLQQLAAFLPSHGSTLAIHPLPAATEESCVDTAGLPAKERILEFVAASRVFLTRVTVALDGIKDDYRDRMRAFEAERDGRKAADQDLKNKGELLKKSEGAVVTLNARIEGFNQEAAKADLDTTKAAEALAATDLKLIPLAAVEEDIQNQQGIKDTHGAAHQAYLSAKVNADGLPKRLVDLAACQAEEAEAASVLQSRQASLSQAQLDFNAEMLVAARAKVVDASSRLATASVRLENARTALGREEERFKELQEALGKQQTLVARRRRLEACIKLTETARQILKASAPKVAEHLCRRIALRAQQLFNQINHEPVELAWNVDPYSLRVGPGDRRFAMLSGGEQTKLALAMTLAMIQEFCGLRFCIFDEPTYGVDADSRPRLAEAIVKAHKAAGFAQLLVVSHDEAFEAQIENTVLLSKTAAGGSEPVYG